jgi:hypothetical protein
MFYIVDYEGPCVQLWRTHSCVPRRHSCRRWQGRVRRDLVGSVHRRMRTRRLNP